MFRALWLLLALPLASCDLFVLCDTSYAGLSVELVDSLTGSLVVAEQIQAIARDGPYADSVYGQAFPPGAIVPLAFDRPGTYRIDVTATGYQPWMREGVRVVRENRCKVRTTRVVALMQRSGSP